MTVPSLHDIRLPSLYTVRPIRVGRAFPEACAIAPSDGAGTLVWNIGCAPIFEAAVVLEPDRALAEARLAHYVAMSALADALATHGPPHKPLAFDWPDRIRVDGAAVGGARLASGPATVAADAVPDWLVIGVALRFTGPAQGAEPGHHARWTALYEEGFGEVEPPALLESFARHFMARLSDWTADGFGRQAEEWLARLAPGVEGERKSLSPEGDLMVFADGGSGRPGGQRHALAEALERPSWLDGFPELA